MSRIEQVSQLVNADRLDELEDLWLATLAEDPADLDFFVGAARSLVDAKEKERAVFLLELVNEQLQEGGRWQDLLELLERAGLLYLEPAEVHRAAMSALQSLYADCPSLEGFIDRVGLRRAIEDTRKTWSKARRLRALMQFESGAYVWMKDKGPGRVVEVNLELESFKLELSGQKSLRVGFAAANKLLRPLDESHIERRKLEALETLLKLKQDDPGELLLIVLQSHEEPLVAADIRKALTGVVEDGEWTGWWAGARKHPQVLATSTKGRQTYRWAASEGHALEDIRQQFANSDTDQKLEILRKNADRHTELRNEMTAELRQIAQERLADRPEEALKIWYTLDKLGAANELPWSPATIAEEAQEPIALAANLVERSLRERFYKVCREVRSDWPILYRVALTREEDSRILTALANQLGAQSPEELALAIDDILGHPRRRPAAFVWLVETGESVVPLTGRNPLRIIRQILDALHQAEFSSFKGRLQKTFETGGGATHLFTRLTEEQAAQAAPAIQRSSLDEHLRDSLVRYLHVRFPSLDKNRATPLYATGASIEKRRRELRKLQQEEIPANRKAIEEARELGDLRENFEYKAARQRHEYLNARLAALNNDLSRVRILDADRINPSEARMGCRIDLCNADGATRSVTILGPWESDPDRQIVSYDSDLGQALLGKRPGDSVAVDDESWTLEAIVPWQ